MTPSEKRVPLSQFLSDSVLFGVGGMADRIIGFLFLPITASILGSAGFGVYNLYTTSSAVLFLLCSVGMPSAYFRFVTDESASKDGLPPLNVALIVTHVLVLLWAPPAIVLAEPLADWLIGADEPAFIYWLCLRTYVDILGALLDCKLQAEGKIRLYLVIRITLTVIVRTASLGALIWYRTPLALAAGEALAATFLTIPVAGYLMREARPRLDRKLANTMIRYGAAMIPGMAAGWVLLAANRYLLKAYSPDQIRDVGLYSLAERFGSVMLLIGQSLWLGWRRFAYRNMHLPDGANLLKSGVTLYFAVASYPALALALLGPITVYLLIDPEFAAAAPLIAPLTLSGFLGAFSNPLRMGLIKENRTMTLSWIAITVAAVTLTLALALIPEYAGFGAVAASLAGQVARTVLTWRAAQRVYYIPFELRRLFYLSCWFAGAYAAARLFETFGWIAALLGALVVLLLLPVLLVRYGPLTAEERRRVLVAAQPVLVRLGLAR